ncbi:MAG: hypothetical protein ICV67_03385 [Thermoleophilia bacterium]|nr:hypothetical protein [Thermoleophilia bacterium]
MRRRSLVALGAVAGAVALVARRRRARPRVDVLYEDGSMVSLDPRLPQAERMLGAARHALALARAGA